MRALLAPLLTWAAVGVAPPAFALQVPSLQAHVNDLAGWLDADERAALERKLAAYERGSGNQFVLLVIPSLEGGALEDFSMRVADAWGIGRRGKDNGLILLIAAAERRMRIEVGYGLEGEITDLLSSRIIRNVLAPAFKQKNFAGGINQAFDLLMQAAGGKAVDVPEGGSAQPLGSLAGWIFFVLLLIFLLRGRGGGWFLLGSLFGSGWSSRRGGGGFGGFGGGGGRFGGGGASGGW